MKNKNEDIQILLDEIKFLRKKIAMIESLQTEKKLYEKSLRFKTRLQKLITTVSAKFISIQPEEIDFWIYKTLRLVGIFAESDRSWIFQFYNDGRMMDLTHEWNHKDSSAMINDAKGIDLHKFPYFYGEFKNHKDIILLNGYQIPEEITEEKNLLNRLKTKSLLIVPLRIRGMLIGMIALSSEYTEMIWTKEIVTFIRIIGEILVNAIVRKRAEEKLKQYHLIVTNASEHMAIIDRNYIYQSVNTALCKAFNLTEPEMLNSSMQETFGIEAFEKIIKPNLDLCFSGYQVKYQAWFEFPVTGRIYMDVICDPLFDNSGNLIGAIEISHDITRLKIAEEELTEAKDRAEKSDKLKTEFLAQISHEIRTPINSMLTFTSIIEEETANLVDEELKNSFKIIGKAGNRIIRTTDLVLDMAELQAGSYETDNEPVDIYDIVDDIVIEYTHFAREKKIDFEIIKKTENSIVYADRYSVVQILKNIIHNALTYTFEGYVKVHINKENERVIVNIIDTGIGISEEYMPRLYEPFSQEDQGFTRRFEGSGLGLALAKKYCEINNIQITVNSIKGNGTQVELIFSPI